MRVLVCGSRTWGVLLDDKPVELSQAEHSRLTEVLDEEHDNHPFDVVIEGEAPGADTFARLWAERNGIAVERYPADWRKYGRAAGPIRNTQMLDEGDPDFVIAFTHDIELSRGTRNMVNQAWERDIPVRIVGLTDSFSRD